MTCSGRVFGPQPPRGTSSETLQGSTNEKAVTPSNEIDISKKLVQLNEANEFLKLIRKSDYKVVDQLQQTPSKISILSLLLNFEAHREALLKELN